MSDLLVADFKYGCRCLDCDKPILNGDPYSKRLVGLEVDVPIIADGVVYRVESICWDCALGVDDG